MTPDPPTGPVQTFSGAISPPDTPAAHNATIALAAPVPTISDHELLRKIGDGSYGEVSLARNAVGTLRAIKIVWGKTFWHAHPFGREFKGIQRFEPLSRDHEGLVDVLQIGRGEGYFYYIMELADDTNENPKFETRDPKEIRTPNDKSETSKESVRISGFGLASDFGMRDSEFYFP